MRDNKNSLLDGLTRAGEQLRRHLNTDHLRRECKTISQPRSKIVALVTKRTGIYVRFGVISGTSELVRPMSALPPKCEFGSPTSKPTAPKFPVRSFGIKTAPLSERRPHAGTPCVVGQDGCLNSILVLKVSELVGLPRQGLLVDE